MRSEIRVISNLDNKFIKILVMKSFQKNNDVKNNNNNNNLNKEKMSWLFYKEHLKKWRMNINES